MKSRKTQSKSVKSKLTPNVKIKKIVRSSTADAKGLVQCSAGHDCC